MFLRTAALGGLVSLSLGAHVGRMKPVTQAEVERLTRKALAMINTVATHVIAKHPGKFVFATTADDVGRTPAIEMVMTAAAA